MLRSTKDLRPNPPFVEDKQIFPRNHNQFMLLGY